MPDFGPKFRGEVLCRTLGQNSGGDAMQDFGPQFRGGGCYAGLWADIFFGGDATQCAFTRRLTVHVKQCQYMLLYIIILHKNMVSVIQHGSGRKSVG